MWDPKRLHQNRTPPKPKDAPRPPEQRPVCEAPAARDGEIKGSRKVILRKLGFVDYLAYIRSPLWKGIREKVMERAESKCEQCGDWATVVHHLNYAHRTMIGADLLSLLALCKHCHDVWHIAPKYVNKRRRWTTRRRKWEKRPVPIEMYRPLWWSR